MANDWVGLGVVFETVAAAYLLLCDGVMHNLGEMSSEVWVDLKLLFDERLPDDDRPAGEGPAALAMRPDTSLIFTPDTDSQTPEGIFCSVINSG